MNIHAYKQLIRAWAKEMIIIECNSMTSYNKHYHAQELIEKKLLEILFESEKYKSLKSLKK